MPEFLTDTKLPRDPDEALEAATKQYVDGHDHDADYVNEADHTKATHDALDIDAATLDGQDSTAFATSGHSHSMALGDLSNVTATGEGAGGGFDADTVDGQHASAFATSGHGHAANPPLADAAPTNPVFGTTAQVGTSGDAAREDHVHAFGSPFSPPNTSAVSSHTGTSQVPARSDHRHGFNTATPVTQAFGNTASAGGASSLSRSDHRHGMPADPLPDAKIYSRSMGLLLGGM